MRESVAGAVIDFLNPDTAVSGGLANRFEGDVLSVRYESWDFNGKARATNGKSGVKMALRVVIGNHNADGVKDSEIDNWLPLGAIEDFVPSDDGLSFTPVSGKTGFDKDGEGMQYIEALLQLGAVSKTDLRIDPRVLGEGDRFFWERIPPKYAARIQDPEKAKKASVLMPVKLTKKGAAGSAPSKSRGGPAPTPASAAAPVADGVELDEAAVNVGTEAITAAGKPLTRNEFSSEVFRLMSTAYKADYSPSQRKKIIAKFDDEAWVEENAGRGTWLYDADKGSVSPSE